MNKLQRMTGYIIKQINFGDSYIEGNFETIEECRSYIDTEYSIDAPDQEDGTVYTVNDDVQVVIQKAPTINELMMALNGMMKGLEEADTYGWYLSDYNLLKEVIYAVGAVDN